jgi:hypothetical protein
VQLAFVCQPEHEPDTISAVLSLSNFDSNKTIYIIGILAFGNFNGYHFNNIKAFVVPDTDGAGLYTAIVMYDNLLMVPCNFTVHIVANKQLYLYIQFCMYELDYFICV